MQATCPHEKEMEVPVQDFDLLFGAGEAELQDLSGKWALVSGASSGIGKAAACALATNNCNVALVARRRDRLEEIRAEIARRKPGVEVEVIVGDVASDEFYASLKEHGVLDRVDFLVNNAGLAKGVDRVGEARFQDWQDMLNVNCAGAFRLVNEVLPGMKSRGRGHVVTTGSIAGIEAYEGGSVYCASKFAAHAFMKALRYETYAHNIRCTVVAPGIVGEGTEFSEVRLGNKEKAAAVYKGIDELRASDVASQIVWCLRQPSHVCLDLVHVMPTAQGGAPPRLHRG